MLIALTRDVPPSISRCELTHIERAVIDVERAVEQHRRYQECLVELGCSVRRLPPHPELPDSVFVEDAAVVFPEIAVIVRPGAPSRRAETESVAEALETYRPMARIRRPGTLDGGDVLRVGGNVFVGQSGRSNSEGTAQLRELLLPFGYRVRPVSVRGCLHLKSAATEVAEATVLLNSQWVDSSVFSSLERVEVHPEEPFAANALRIGRAIVHATAHTRTRRVMEQRGLTVHPVEADELAKAEAGVTCCSILVPVPPG